jgi:hypothetical protein
MWDCGLYAMSPKSTNPMRSIIKLDKNGDMSRVATKYFEHMSTAIARLCGGDVESIHLNLLVHREIFPIDFGIFPNVIFPPPRPNSY